MEGSSCKALPHRGNQGKGYQYKILPSHLLTCSLAQYSAEANLTNTLLDNALDVAETYFHLQTSTYKTASNGYIIICSP
jgi:hypothetical protein